MSSVAPLMTETALLLPSEWMAPAFSVPEFDEGGAGVSVVAGQRERAGELEHAPDPEMLFATATASARSKARTPLSSTRPSPAPRRRRRRHPAACCRDRGRAAIRIIRRQLKLAPPEKLTAPLPDIALEIETRFNDCTPRFPCRRRRRCRANPSSRPRQLPAWRRRACCLSRCYCQSRSRWRARTARPRRCR